jgi:hypothetical protein
MMKNTYPEGAQVLVPLQDLSSFFRDIVREEFKLMNQEELQEKYISPREARKILPVSQPTLDSYAAKGWLTKYHLGGRTWYKYNEVLSALKQIKKYSRLQPQP